MKSTVKISHNRTWLTLLPHLATLSYFGKPFFSYLVYEKTPSILQGKAVFFFQYTTPSQQRSNIILQWGYAVIVGETIALDSRILLGKIMFCFYSSP